MVCTNPVHLRNPELTVPCGKCIACRIAKSKEWSIRIIHELAVNPDACFVTLTYADPLPDPPHISKHTLQLFLKKLREAVKPRKIRYFASGEYGDITERPHYHAILFGLPPTTGTKQLLETTWAHGFVHVGTVTPNSARYVADYIMKKLDGPALVRDGREPPFALKSQGLGKQWALQHEKHITTEGLTWRGVPQQLPRYYLGILDVDQNKLRQQARERYNRYKRKLYRSEPRPSHVWLVEENQQHQANRNLEARAKLYKKGDI